MVYPFFIYTDIYKERELLVMLFSYVLGFVILFAYIIYIICKDKSIPESISATVYSLDSRNRWIYTIVVFIAAFLIAPHLFEITSVIGIEYVAYLTILGMLGTGADPLVHGDKNIVHYCSAVLMGGASQSIVFMLCPFAMMLWLPYVVYTLYMEDGRWNMMFGEIVMIIALLICGIVR
jgi:hypothetical protein